MADNYLEKHREEYEARKAEWLRRKHRAPIQRKKLEKPEDEALWRNLVFSYKNKPARCISTSGRKTINQLSQIVHWILSDEITTTLAKLCWQVICHPEAIFYLKIPYWKDSTGLYWVQIYTEKCILWLMSSFISVKLPIYWFMSIMGWWW